jgi:hypothetical protein
MTLFLSTFRRTEADASLPASNGCKIPLQLKSRFVIVVHLTLRHMPMMMMMICGPYFVLVTKFVKLNLLFKWLMIAAGCKINILFHADGLFFLLFLE